MVSTRWGYCSLLCTTVADIEMSQFLDFFKVFEAESWLVYVIEHGGPRQHDFDMVQLLYLAVYHSSGHEVLL